MGSRPTGGPARMGRPPVVDRETIVRTSLEIGFSRLTMSAVGTRLGISHSTLYGYFRNRDELIAAAIEHVVDAIEWPEPGADWREFLITTARAHWRLYAAHPGLAREITALRLTGPALVRRDNQTGVRLLRYGFRPVDAVLVVDMLAELVAQAFLAAPQQAGDSGGTGGGADALGEIQRRRRELTEPWLDLYDERLRAELADAVTGSVEAWFERKLALFLDGVAALRPGPTT